MSPELFWKLEPHHHWEGADTGPGQVWVVWWSLWLAVLLTEVVSQLSLQISCCQSWSHLWHLPENSPESPSSEACHPWSPGHLDLMVSCSTLPSLSLKWYFVQSIFFLWQCMSERIMFLLFLWLLTIIFTWRASGKIRNVFTRKSFGYDFSIDFPKVLYLFIKGKTNTFFIVRKHE